MTMVTEPELHASIHAGNAHDTFALLEPHPTAELKQFQKSLAKIRAEQRELQRTDWTASRTLGGTLVVAGVLCSDTPAQAAGWLGRRDSFNDFERNAPDPQDVLVRRHDAAWLSDLALRLAERLRQDDDYTYWSFVEHLAASSGALLPLSPAYVHGWLDAARHARWETRRGGEPFVLADWLRRQSRLPERMEAVFATDNAGSELAEYPGYEVPEASTWPKAITTLIAEGVLDRAPLIDSCTARLLRGDKPGSLRGVLGVFEELAPTREEVRERLGTYQSMATSATGTVAKIALRELRALDAEEPFEPLDLAELSEGILARPESGLATGQLTWLDAALKRDPGAAAILLPCLGTAFTHPASSVQQRALKLLAKHMKKADSSPSTLSALRDAAQSIDPALRAEADQLLAAPVEPATTTETAAPGHDSLPTYQPTPLPTQPSTPEELVTAFAPTYANGEITPLEAEQIMAAVAVLSYRDRVGLAEAFRPLYDRYDDGKRKLYIGHLQQFPTALRCLLEAVLGQDHRSERTRVAGDSKTTPKTALVLRIQELTDQLLHGRTVPLLLATPTEASGAIDPAVFESRMATYREQGIKPLPLDLEHAQLRVTPDPARAKAFAELPIGEPLATDESLGKPIESPNNGAKPRSRDVLSLLSNIRTSTASTLAPILLLPDLAQDGTLRLPQPPSIMWTNDPQSEFMPIMLPHDPDLVAAHLLTRLYEQANDKTPYSGVPSSAFPTLAETAGVPGPLTHLALVYALAADKLENRIAAQDAVLILASRSRLRPEQLGRLAAVAWQRDLVRGKRIVDALAQIEESGASKEIFATTAAMLAPLSKTPEIRGLPDVLLLATRSAISAEIRGVDVPTLTELAALAKPKRVGIEARRLQAALHS